MGSESRNGDGYGGGEVAVPATAKKVVQSVKEIVNCCSEQEIYAVLRECDMDPNRSVERLLAQDTFHEVRSKRERRKEMKEALDSRTGGGNGGLSCGGKFGNGTGSDRGVTNSGLTHVIYNEHAKSANKGEVGSIGTSVTPSTAHVVGKSVSDSVSTDSGRPSFGTRDSISVFAQVSSGLQTSLLGVSKGHLSMADIVRMGRTSQNAVSHDHYTASGVSESGNSESMLSLHCQNHSEQQVFHDKWPVNEQPITGNSQALNMFASSKANRPFEHSSLRDTAVSLRRNCELDASQISWGGVATDDVISSNAVLGSHSNSNLKDTCSSDFHSSYGHHEDVSSAASDLQRLSMRESKLEVPLSEDNPTVVLPNNLHLPALAAKCSHLSFGTFNGSSNTASSLILASNLSRNGLEEKSAAVDSSLAQFPNSSSVHHGDKQLEFEILRGTANNKNDDFLSSPQQELLKHIISEETLGHEYNTVASVSDPSLPKTHWVTPSSPLDQPGLHSGSHSNFPREMRAESNSIPGDVLAFLRSQAQPVGYNNAVSSISNSANSIYEVMEPGAFALPRRSAVSQDLTVQSSKHFQQLPDMEGCFSLPQNHSYMTTVNSQQAFSGNPPYNQSPVDMRYNFRQNRNELLMSRLLPATARDTYGYGNLGSSLHGPGSFLSNSSLGYMMPSRNLDEISPSQYNGGRNISSIQQHGNLSRWDYVAESRSSFLPERTQYNLMGQQQRLGSLPQYVNPGHSDLYQTQRRIVDELQRPGGFQDLSSNQLHQLWQHIH